MHFQTSWTEASQHGGADGGGHSGRARPLPVPQAHLQRRLTPSRAACSSTADADPLQGSVLVHSGGRPSPGPRACPQWRPTPSRAACSSTVEPDPRQGRVPVYSSSTGLSAPETRSPSPRAAGTPGASAGKLRHLPSRVPLVRALTTSRDLVVPPVARVPACAEALLPGCPLWGLQVTPASPSVHRDLC